MQLYWMPMPTGRYQCLENVDQQIVDYNAKVKRMCAGITPTTNYIQLYIVSLIFFFCLNPGAIDTHRLLSFMSSSYKVANMHGNLKCG